MCWKKGRGMGEVMGEKEGGKGNAKGEWVMGKRRRKNKWLGHSNPKHSDPKHSAPELKYESFSVTTPGRPNYFK